MTIIHHWQTEAEQNAVAPGVGWINEETPAMPEVSDAALVSFLDTVTPLLRQGDSLFAFDLPDLRNTAFTFGPKNLRKVAGFVELISLPTLHTCGYHGFFKPSIAEVVASIVASGAPDVIQFNAFYLDDDVIDIYKDGDRQRSRVVLGKIEQ